jgi:hypothetical protein
VISRKHEEEEPLENQSWLSNPQAASHGLANASLATGLVGIVGVVVPLGIFVAAVAGPLAIGLGIAALRRPAASGESGQAFTGIALGTVATLIAIGTIFVFRHILWSLIARFAA